MDRLAQLFPDAPVRLTFHEYMRRALYHAQAGYYSTRQPVFGAAGDYYTSFYVHPIVAELLTDQMVEIWMSCGTPASFALVEYGGGEGLFAEQGLDYARRRHPGFWKAVRYHGVEISASGWATSGEPTSPVPAVVFSNEFFDAWPVHRLVARNRQWFEIYVEIEDNRIRETIDEVSDRALLEYVRRYKVPARRGQQVEIRPGVARWYDAVGLYLEQGGVLTVDYGYLARELYSPSRRQGTLMCYHRHRAHEDPYAHVGQQDITSHVNFTELIDAGRAIGLVEVGFFTQREFLLNRGLLERIESDRELVQDNIDSLRRRLQVKTLVVPGGISDTLKILVQGRGMK